MVSLEKQNSEQPTSSAHILARYPGLDPHLSPADAPNVVRPLFPKVLS